MFNNKLVICYLLFTLILSLITLTYVILKYKYPDLVILDNFRRRVKSSWVLFIISLLFFSCGKVGVVILFTFISFFALREFLSLTPLKASDYNSVTVAFYVFLPVQYMMILFGWEMLYYIFIPVYGFLTLPILSITKDDDEHFFDRAAKFQWATMACIYCISYTAAIMDLDIKDYHEKSILLLIFFIFVIGVSDSMQYFLGKLIGKKKVAPKISPNKTVEGTIYGCLCAILAGTAMYWITPFKPWQALLISSAIVISGFFGGLVMSAIKRSMKVKDWGNMLDGHGGILDRVDSLCFAAPLFYHIVRYFFH